MSDTYDLAVIGGGPGGYSAAFRGADLGLRTVLVDDRDQLGGVCLNVGCIPSKALLHAADIIVQAREADAIGLEFGRPRIALDRLRTSTGNVVDTLASGLSGLARKRGVQVVRGRARFADAATLTVDGADAGTIGFRQAIVAVGSRPVALPGLPDDARIVDSTGALALERVPDHLLVIGGGIVGLEMATVYNALGAEVTVVELQDQLVPGCDPDLVKPLATRLAALGVAIHTASRVDEVATADEHLSIRIVGADGECAITADLVLVAVGRRPNGDTIEAQAAGVHVDERGFIQVDDRLRTSAANVYAIGDVVGNPMLAHKASHQGHVAAENAAGHDSVFDARAIPSVAYTDPEIAWAGLTETDAGDTPYEVAAFPWSASGRALSLGRTGGRTKLLIDPGTRRVLGAGIVGPNAGELIAEVALAIEMGAVAEDLARTIHPHPTLSETVGLAAEWADGTITDLYRPAPRAERATPPESSTA